MDMWAKNIGKRKFQSLVGCVALPMGIKNNPRTCPDQPRTIPKTSQGSPKALLVFKKFPRTSDELAVTKQQ